MAGGHAIVHRQNTGPLRNRTKRKDMPQAGRGGHRRRQRTWQSQRDLLAFFHADAPSALCTGLQSPTDLSSVLCAALDLYPSEGS